MKVLTYLAQMALGAIAGILILWEPNTENLSFGRQLCLLFLVKLLGIGILLLGLEWYKKSKKQRREERWDEGGNVCRSNNN